MTQTFRSRDEQVDILPGDLAGTRSPDPDKSSSCPEPYPRITDSGVGGVEVSEMKPVAWVDPEWLPGNGRSMTGTMLSERETESRSLALYSACQMAQKDAEIIRLNEELSGYHEGLSALMAKEIANMLEEKEVIKIKLERCPMCGGSCSFGNVTYPEAQEPHAWFADGTPVKTAHFVNCQRCGLNNQTIAGGYQTQFMAANHWNTRKVEARGTAEERERVVALDVRVAELEEVKEKKQEEARRYRNALEIICDKTSEYSVSHKTARTALQREG